MSIDLSIKSLNLKNNKHPPNHSTNKPNNSKSSITDSKQSLLSKYKEKSKIESSLKSNKSAVSNQKKPTQSSNSTNSSNSRKPIRPPPSTIINEPPGVTQFSANKLFDLLKSMKTENYDEHITLNNSSNNSNIKSDNNEYIENNSKQFMSEPINITKPSSYIPLKPVEMIDSYVIKNKPISPTSPKADFNPTNFASYNIASPKSYNLTPSNNLINNYNIVADRLSEQQKNTHIGEIAKKVIQPPGGMSSINSNIDFEEAAKLKKIEMQKRMKEDLDFQMALKGNNNSKSNNRNSRINEDEGFNNNLANFKPSIVVSDDRRRQLESNPFTADPKQLELEKRERMIKEKAILFQQMEEKRAEKKQREHEEKMRLLLEEEKDRRYSENQNRGSNNDQFSPKNRQYLDADETRKRVMQSNPFTSDPAQLEKDKKSRRVQELADYQTQIAEQRLAKEESKRILKEKEDYEDLKYAMNNDDFNPKVIKKLQAFDSPSADNLESYRGEIKSPSKRAYVADEFRQRNMQSNPFTADPRLLEKEKRERFQKEREELRIQMEEQKRIKMQNELKRKQEDEEEERKYQAQFNKEPISKPKPKESSIHPIKSAFLEQQPLKITSPISSAPASRLSILSPQNSFQSQENDPKVQLLVDQVSMLLQKQDVMMNEISFLKEKNFVTPPIESKSSGIPEPNTASKYPIPSRRLSSLANNKPAPKSTSPAEPPIDPFSIAYKASKARKSVMLPLSKKDIPSRFGNKRTQSANPASKRNNEFNIPNTIKEGTINSNSSLSLLPNRINSSYQRPSSANFEVQSRSEFVYPSDNDWFEDDTLISARNGRSNLFKSHIMPNNRSIIENEAPRNYNNNNPIPVIPIRRGSILKSFSRVSFSADTPEPHTRPLENNYNRQSYQDVSASQYYESNFDAENSEPYFPEPQSYPYEPVILHTINNHVNPNLNIPKSKPRVVANPFAQAR